MPDVAIGSAHLFGTEATGVSNMTLISVDLEKDFEINQKTPGSDGKTIEKRMDGKMITGTITGYIRDGFANYAPGAVITLADLSDSDLNDEYTIEKVGQARKAGEKIQVTLTIEHLDSLTYS